MESYSRMDVSNCRFSFHGYPVFSLSKRDRLHIEIHISGWDDCRWTHACLSHPIIGNAQVVVRTLASLGWYCELWNLCHSFSNYCVVTLDQGGGHDNLSCHNGTIACTCDDKLVRV